MKKIILFILIAFFYGSFVFAQSNSWNAMELAINNDIRLLKAYQEHGVNSVFENKQLEITIEALKKEYTKGELIDVIVRVKNNSKDTINFNIAEADHHLYSYEENKTISYFHPTMHTGAVIIPPYGEYITIIDPLKFINYKKEDKTFMAALPWYYWSEGNYDYYINYKIDKAVYTSNRIPLTINPVPDSLKEAFDALKVFYPYTQYGLDYREALYEKYKGTFYDKEFLYNLLNTWSYSNAIAGKQEASGLRNRGSIFI